MTSWRNYFESKLAVLAEAGTVHDIGGGADPQDRARFRNYVMIDVNETYKPDIVADIQALPFADASLEAVLCLDVLEHVEDPFKAVSELRRVMKPGAKMLASVPFIWPYHAEPPLYGDYWRFSQDGLRTLFRGFSSIEIVKKGGYLSTLVNFIPSYTRLDRLFRPIAAWLDDHGFTPGRSTAPAHLIFVIK